MTKGPPGLLALIPVVVFTLLRIDRRRIGQVFTPVGMLAFAVVSLARYVAAIARHPDLLRYWLYHEVAGRVGSNEYRNSEWYYAFIVYLPTLLVGTAPWFKPAWRILAGARQIGSRHGWADFKARDGQGVFLLLWFAIPLACFMVVRARLPLYVVPLWAPRPLAIARAMAGARTPAGCGRFHGLLAAWCVALLGLNLGAAYVPSAQDTGALAASIQRSGARFDEIVDVGGTPHYALSLYLGVNVERVHLDPSGSLNGSSTVESLGRELESDRSS
jgi:hypothetical protein